MSKDVDDLGDSPQEEETNEITTEIEQVSPLGNGHERAIKRSRNANLARPSLDWPHTMDYIGDVRTYARIRCCWKCGNPTKTRWFPDVEIINGKEEVEEENEFRYCEDENCEGFKTPEWTWRQSY